MDAKLYIKNKIRNANSNIDLSEGSAVTNLMVNPLSTILQPLLDEQDKLINNVSLITPDAIAAGDVDGVAANFLVTRREANRSTGEVKFYYTGPLAVTIPLGTVVSTADNVLFKTTIAYTITKSDMASNVEEYPLYCTDNIPVECVALGEEGNVLANTIEKIVSSLTPAPVKVTNQQAAFGATAVETNSSLASRVKQTFVSNTVTNPNAIKKVIMDSYPDTKKVEVIGFGDPEMVRDIIVSGMTAQDYYLTDLEYKASGVSLPPHNPSSAWYGRFTDIDPSENVTLPNSVTDFYTEFDQDMYNGMFRKDDVLYAQSAEYQILNETFSAGTGVVNDIDGSTPSAGTATVTTNEDHGLTVGTTVTIANTGKTGDITGISGDGTDAVATSATDFEAEVGQTINITNSESFTGQYVITAVTTSAPFQVTFDHGTTATENSVSNYETLGLYDGVFTVNAAPSSTTFEISSTETATNKTGNFLAAAHFNGIAEEGWHMSDGLVGLDQLVAIDEMRTDQGHKVLGKTYVANEDQQSHYGQQIESLTSYVDYLAQLIETLQVPGQDTNQGGEL